jgi:hypothetical protein
MAGAMPKTAPAIKVEAELPKAPTTTALAPYYPPNNGALGTETYRLFSPGDKIARYGSEYGSYTTDVGTPPQMLSLPPNQIGRPESIYMFKTYFWAYESKAAPWFGQIGGGTQYRFPLSIDELIKNEIISRW